MSSGCAPIAKIFIFHYPLIYYKHIYEKSKKKIKGYIEGFYGKLYSWDDRINILDTMSQK